MSEMVKVREFTFCEPVAGRAGEYKRVTHGALIRGVRQTVPLFFLLVIERNGDKATHRMRFDLVTPGAMTVAYAASGILALAERPVLRQKIEVTLNEDWQPGDFELRLLLDEILVATATLRIDYLSDLN